MEEKLKLKQHRLYRVRRIPKPEILFADSLCPRSIPFSEETLWSGSRGSFKSCCRLPVFCECTGRKREDRAAMKVEKREGEDTKGRATISGRRTSCTAYPGHRTSKVRARGNTRVEMPSMPRQRRTECVPAGRRPRGTFTMADEAAGRSEVTFNMEPSRWILWVRLRIKI